MRRTPRACHSPAVRSVAAWLDRLLACGIAAVAAASRRPPELDLHGLGVRDAVAATERFLAEAHADGVREVRIVYGKGRHSPDGRGVLREVVPRWLDGAGRRWIARADPEPDARGEDAAIRVRLRAGDEG
ncbi:MAG: Smr/MutS family protein [Deltaproteobacteria bacterium]|nr:Smr/MutS family protein [Deltaproteobacteria bacterium]